MMTGSRGHGNRTCGAQEVHSGADALLDVGDRRGALADAFLNEGPECGFFVLTAPGSHHVLAAWHVTRALPMMGRSCGDDAASNGSGNDCVPERNVQQREDEPREGAPAIDGRRGTGVPVR